MVTLLILTSFYVYCPCRFEYHLRNKEEKACYLSGEGGGARGDGGRTAGRRQAHTVVNGICDFLFLLLERATVFAIVGTC